MQHPLDQFQPTHQCWKCPTHGRETENSVTNCSKYNPRKFGFSKMFLDYAVVIVVTIGADGSGESSDWSQRSASWKSSSDLNCESAGRGPWDFQFLPDLGIPWLPSGKRYPELPTNPWHLPKGSPSWLPHEVRCPLWCACSSPVAGLTSSKNPGSSCI